MEAVECIAHFPEAVRGKVFFHTANSLTSDELGELRVLGGHIASFSPLQTFPRFEMSDEVFTGISFIGEGDERALTLVRQIARNLGANFLEVEKERKIYVHIAAVSVSNFFTGLLKFAEDQLRNAVSPDKRQAPPDISILLPLVKRTLENVEKSGVTASITGPVRRRQWPLIQKHIAILPDREAEIYRLMSKYLSDILGIDASKELDQ